MITHHRSKLHVRKTSSVGVSILHIRFQEHIRHDNLDLVDGKEPSGAGVPPITEDQVGRANTDKLSGGGRPGRTSALLMQGHLSSPRVLEGVKLFAIGEDVVVKVGTDGGDFNLGASGKNLAARKCDGFEKLAVE